MLRCPNVPAGCKKIFQSFHPLLEWTFMCLNPFRFPNVSWNCPGSSIMLHFKPKALQSRKPWELGQCTYAASLDSSDRKALTAVHDRLKLKTLRKNNNSRFSFHNTTSLTVYKYHRRAQMIARAKGKKAIYFCFHHESSVCNLIQKCNCSPPPEIVLR